MTPPHASTIVVGLNIPRTMTLPRMCTIHPIPEAPAAIADVVMHAVHSLVVAVDIDGALAENVAQSLRAHQHRILAITADVGSVPDIQRMVDRTISDYGRADRACLHPGRLSRPGWP